ncbi:MAG: tRNA (adenosine(37)-N6)-threonylcarbamoyltransferase complex ATPase subunit type 1 TsaE [Treponema sp.]|uniref:tRNA (adenosine(37)-N6)-threonylcarbamoyltransferase complex ATPase subunit type 1 TsaE n=1 Tax=Treponema sp. TaxID=166 RepID=UPI003FA1EEBD
MILTTKTAEETIKLGTAIGQLLQPGDILALQGTLAAGKTQLTKGIAEGLGISEPVTSPTFTIISEYYGRMPLYHIDVYRLGSPEDFLDLGVDDMLYGQGVCVIEWSEKIMSELPSRTILIHIEAQPDSRRTLTITNWQYSADTLVQYEAVS